jgi:hypothetical protein
MIAEGRLKGSIDQSKSLLHFLGKQTSDCSILTFLVDNSVLTQWDTHIDLACNSVNSVVDKLTTLYPAWMVKQF